MLYLSTHGVRSSETVRLCTVHSSFFSCLSVVPYKWEKEPCLEGNSAGVALSAAAAAERGGFFAAHTVSSDTFFINPMILPVIFDRASINPTPLLTFPGPFTCAQIQEFSVLTSQAVVFSFSLLVCIEETSSRVRSSDRLDRAFTAWC